VWRKSLGSDTDLRANGDNSGPSAGVIDQADIAVWRGNFGKTNPPATGAASVDEPARIIAPTTHDRNKPALPSQAAAAAIILPELPVKHPVPSASVNRSSPAQGQITWELALLSVLDEVQTATTATEDYSSAPNDDESPSDDSSDYSLAVDADDNWETTLRTLANDIYCAINETGDI
jgi:hypothetical protein